MTEPTHHFRDAFDFFSRRNQRTPHHHDRQTEFARGLDLGVGRIATGVFGYHDVDAMLHQHRAVAFEIERSARHDHLSFAQRQRRTRRIDQPQQIMMPRMSGKSIEVLSPDTEEYPARHGAEHFGRRSDVIDFDPVIAGHALPRHALERQQRHFGQRAGGGGMRTHLRRERMGRIDDAFDLFGAKIVDQSFYAAKAADTPRDRRRRRVFSAAGVGQDRIDPRVPGDLGHQPVGIGGAAEDQNPQSYGRGGCHGRER